MDSINVDFHSHSTFSDGAFTPQELCNLMNDAWVKILSITDHDSMWAFMQSIETNISILPWIEITTHYSWKTLHVLAYGLNPNSHDVNTFLQRQRISRRERAMRITDLLNHDLENEWFMTIPHDVILWLEIEWPITRPDIAKYLMSIGYISSFHEAFDRWLGKYDVPVESWSINEVLSIVNDNRWKTILAHPFAPHVSLKTITSDVSYQIELLLEFRKQGLHGIEWFISDISNNTHGHIVEQLHWDNWFLVTGWSDFHGGNKTTVLLPGISMPKNYVDEFVDSVNFTI